MDRVIEKTKTERLMKYWPYAVVGCLVLGVGMWLVFGNHASTLKVNRDELTVSEVRQAEFKDYVRTNGQVLPIQVVQISPEEGGIVMEKVVEEGTHVKKGDVIVRLSNSNLDLQILNAEAELAEKQNLLRNTQVAMQQDRLNNQTEQAQLDMDTQRKRRTFEQNKRLYQEKLISREDYIKSQEDYQLSAKKRSLVSKRLKQDSLYRNVQMDQMEDNLQNMRRNVVLVRQRKGKLEVRSAIDGELGLLDVELGQSIQPGQKIGQLNDLSDYKVQAQMGSPLPLPVATSNISYRCARSIPRYARASSAAISSSAARAPRTSAQARPTTSTSNWAIPSRPCSSPAALSSRPRAGNGFSCSTKVARKPIAEMSVLAVRIRSSTRCLRAWSPVSASSPAATRPSKTMKCWSSSKSIATSA